MIPPEELRERIGLGEDTSLELKRVETADQRVLAPHRDSIADELAAFANGRGGTLVLGVDDDTKAIVGVDPDHLDAVERWLREICTDVIEPPLDAAIWKRRLPAAAAAQAEPTAGDAPVVLHVDVPRSLFVHRSPGGYFRRIGSSKRQLRPDALARLFQDRSQSRVIRFDESPVPGTRLADLDPSLAQRFLRDDEGDLDQTALHKARIVAPDDDGIGRLTVAGALMCTAHPQAWLPHAYIQAVYYAGERQSPDYQVDARDIDGPLDRQIADCLHFLRRNMFVPARKHVGRVDVPQYSERAVFEALANAVAHRDYSLAGARIRFHMFADRIELYVPGGLANTLTPDDLDRRQYSRNELVVSLLARCGTELVDPRGELGRRRIMDRRGDGVPLILSESTELSGRRPRYSLIGESELGLVIWAAAPPPMSDENGG